MTPIHKLSVLAICVGMLAACSSTPVAPPAAAPMAPPPSVAPAKPAPQPIAIKQELPAYLDPANPLYRERSIYFAYDDYSIKQDYAAMIERHGKYLFGHPQVAIKVEGNADERGGAEYNLALGQKRANAVIKALKAFGVKEAQLEAVSWGKEKPKALDHNEAAWAQNRRVDLDYPKN